MITPNRILAMYRSDYDKMVARGETLESLRRDIINSISQEDFLSPVAFAASLVREVLPNVHANHTLFHNFKGVVVATYTINGAFCIHLATGDILEVNFRII